MYLGQRGATKLAAKAGVKVPPNYVTWLKRAIYKGLVDGWMDRWMDGWMVGWLVGWMDGWWFICPSLLPFSSQIHHSGFHM